MRDREESGGVKKKIQKITRGKIFEQKRVKSQTASRTIVAAVPWLRVVVIDHSNLEIGVEKNQRK